MIIINKPEELEEVQCYKCKKIMKAHPMSNINSDYFTNCESHMTSEVIIDAPYHTVAESAEKFMKSKEEFANKLCEQNKALFKAISEIKIDQKNEDL